MSAKEIAETTLMYLGGTGRLKAMINARDFSYDDEGTLKFKFSSYPKANVVYFILTPMDDYTIEFRKVTASNNKLVKTIDGLHFDQLKPVFEEETGLYLSL